MGFGVINQNKRSHLSSVLGVRSFSFGDATRTEL